MLEEVVKREADGMVAKAYRFAEKAHAGQKRVSGEPYFSHCLATAEQLSEWKLDEATIAAGLLHDVLEDTKTTCEELKREFGMEVVKMVEGVSRISQVGHRAGREQAAGKQAELLRKLILSLTEDVRMVLVKLADRLHNMKTLSALPEMKRRRIALETAEVYAPLAYQLGMRRLSGELEDLAFPYIDPTGYQELVRQVAARYGEREAYLRQVKPILARALKAGGVTKAEINYRAKRYLSLYKKLKHYKGDLEQIYDLVAFRIIVPTIEQCYQALGIIHGLWPPMPGRIKDYISMPKPNGYQSLHTTVFCEEGAITEFQIRTREMHEEAEYGVAAHWIYKQQPSNQAEKKKVERFKEEAKWLKNLSDWRKTFRSQTHFLETLKIDFLKDRIFALTPKGEVYDLPRGSTPVDFAYRIHSELGDETIGAKVNGTIVPLNYELKSGEVVEVMRQKGKQPSEGWLGFIKTQSARDHIRQALNKKRRRLEAKTV